ncbi:hypothetical protein TNCV_1792821 [Trichonephila clavipes]|nr:hypothetical protein TNCV_1792821 [Trichonephila clavipes]
MRSKLVPGSSIGETVFRLGCDHVEMARLDVTIVLHHNTLNYSRGNKKIIGSGLLNVSTEEIKENYGGSEDL